MDTYSKEFINDYKSATDMEFEIFLIKQNIHSSAKEGISQVALVGAKEDVTEMEKSFSASRQKLASYQLSPQQAISIINESNQTDDRTMDLNGIDGADTYRFMNKAIQANPEVAHTAWKQNKHLEKHFPLTLKDRMEGHKPEQVFESMNSGLSIDRSVDILNTVRDMTSRLTAKPKAQVRGMSLA